MDKNEKQAIFNDYMEKLEKLTRLVGYCDGLVTAVQFFDVIKPEALAAMTAEQLADSMKKAMTHQIEETIEENEQREKELQEIFVKMEGFVNV